MYNIIVFAGTTEGYEISRFLAANKISVLACVATEYGSKSIEESAYLKIMSKRLNADEMMSIFKEEDCKTVIDATHPYAAEVTSNISKACQELGVQYVRVLRDQGSRHEAVYVNNVEEAVDYLAKTDGNVLLTTGSKELKAFTKIDGYKERLFARVLSVPSVIDNCRELGFEGRNLIAMQGPFSKELNLAMLRQYDCRYIVTKDSGKAGGFEEKIDAAHECNAIPVIIGRPLKENGISLNECKRMMCSRFNLHPGTHVTLLGIGMGNHETLTLKGKNAIENADLIIGARRMVEAVALRGQDVIYEYKSERIAEYIKLHPEYSNVVVALSGDVGFYSGARGLLELLGDDTEVICGISSVVYFMARIGLSWDDAKLVSAHGRRCNLVSYIRNNKKVFAILGTADGVAELSKTLTNLGMGDVTIYVGENLSYDNEKIFSDTASNLKDYKGDALCVICAYNKVASVRPVTHGMSDDTFIRGKAPMTKSEIRTVSLSKLKLEADSVCYDVGAGTGSVSVEMALCAVDGHVYSIEKKEDALDVLRKNQNKFALDNMTIISGTAPDSMIELPSPTHAFIGGSSGNLKDILGLLFNKNENIRIVINCITLETVSEAISCIKDMEKAFPDKIWETEIVQMAVARAKNIGSYHMMMGENPIYIITIQAHKEDRA